MMQSFFTFLKSLFILGEHAVSSIQTKIEDNQDEFKSKLDKASEHIRSRCGIPKDSTDNS